MSNNSLIDVPAVFLASAVGGLWLWLYLLFSGQSLGGSVLLLVLLLPFLGLASSTVMAMLVLPMWWFLRRTSLARPHRFVSLVASVTTLLSVAVSSTTHELSLRERLLALTFVAIWLGSMAAVFSVLARRQEHAPRDRPNPSIERTPSSVLRTLPAAAHVKR